MKIGFFTDFYLPQANGVATSVETFRVELEKLGHEVYVFAPSPGFRHRDASPRIIRFPAVKGLFYEEYLTSLFFPPQAISKIDKLGLDIVHYHTPSQIGLLGAYYAMRKDVPLVTTYHTDLYEYVKHYPAVLPGIMAISLSIPFITGGGLSEYRSALSSVRPERNVHRWNQKIIVHAITQVHNNCDAVITPSIKIQNVLKLWRTKSRIQVIPTGSDALNTTKDAVARARKHYHINDNDQVILSVGRISQEKNPELLIKAFDQIATKHSHAKLMMVGEGLELDKLRDQVSLGRYAKRIIFTGRIAHQDMGAIYALAHIFAFPSLTDTQGLVLNEAAHAGLPIVMIDAQINNVFVDGENGLIARAIPRDFAAKITQILADTTIHHQMSLRSRELAKSCSAGNQAQLMSNLYGEVISSHKPRKT